MGHTSLIERALAPGNLDLAWRHLAGDRAPWLPGLPREEMERNRLRHQLQLVDDVRRGHYRPAGMRQFTLQKPGGGERVLSAACLRDKFLQRAVAQVLDAECEPRFHHDSYGYRRGRGVPHALERCAERIRCGLPWLVDADIHACFDRIPHAPLLRTLRRELGDRPLETLVGQWLDAVPGPHGILERRRGIPQGAPVSAVLCNLYLHALDRAWMAKGIPFVRYADDFLLFLPDQSTARRALDYTRRQLAALQLDLHPDKTRVVHAGEGVVFLGQPLQVPRRLRLGQTPEPPAAPAQGLAKWLTFKRLGT